MRLRKEKLQEKLQASIEWAELLLVGLNAYRDEKENIVEPVAKAEARVQYDEDYKSFHKELRRITKFSYRLGYSEEETKEIITKIYWPNGKPAVKIPTV